MTVGMDRYIREHLSYDPATGIVVWMAAPSRNSPQLVGREAGRINSHGYRELRANKVLHSAHRVAWFLYYGEWPTLSIDHRDRNRTNNKIDNLRQATQFEQNGNSRERGRPLSKGVRLNRNSKGYGRGYSARITIEYKELFLGVFDTPDLAARAYKKAALKYFGLFASHVSQ